MQIYDEHGGKVTKLAEDGSNLLPEMLQLKDGDVPAIAVPILRWTKGKNGESEQTLTSANLYLLQPNEVKVLKDVPWSKRLQAAK